MRFELCAGGPAAYGGPALSFPPVHWWNGKLHDWNSPAEP